MHPGVKKIYLHALKSGHDISMVGDKIHIDKGEERGWGGKKTSIQLLDNECFVLTGYNDDGNIRYIRHYENGNLHGRPTGFYDEICGESNQIRYEGEYTNNQKHGDWKHYNAVGNLERTEIFENGKLVNTIERSP